MAVVAPLLVYLYPPSGNTKKKDVNVTLDTPLDQIKNGDAVKFQAPPETGFIMADGGGDNAPGKVAFSGYAVKDLAGKLSVFAVNCSHLGCSVAFNAGALRFQCPCHGSQFNIDGNVVHGPAAYPLSHLTWRQGSSPSAITVSSYELKGIG